MTEQEWAVSTDPRTMLKWLWEADSISPVSRPRLPSDRKLRLFACGCMRATWHLISAEGRAATEAAERFADGGIVLPVGEWTVLARDAARAALLMAEWGREQRSRDHVDHPATQAALLRDIVGNPWRPWLRVPEGAEVVYRAGVDRLLYERWLTPTVVSLAQAAYDDRTPDDGTLDPNRLAVLADALLDVGCDNTDLLQHLRGREQCRKCGGSGEGGDNFPDWQRGGKKVTCNSCGNEGWRPSRGPHVRGCWALDLLLGKS